MTWKTASDEDLIWIVESGPESWKDLAKEELNYRNQDVSQEAAPISKAEVDDMFGVEEGEKSE